MIHLDMGKYAGFVWPAYGISLLVLLGLVADSLAAVALSPIAMAAACRNALS